MGGVRAVRDCDNPLPLEDGASDGESTDDDDEDGDDDDNKAEKTKKKMELEQKMNLEARFIHGYMG